MITIFSNPRPFTGPFYQIQLNAIKSWLALGSEVEVILFEDEEGTTGPIAEQLGVACIKDVACNEYGTPLLSSVFEKVKGVARHEIICQVNADIILNRSFLEGVKRVKALLPGKNFFMTGRRWDLDFKETIDFADVAWDQKILTKAKTQGVLHSFSGMDYWMFPKKIDFKVPAFVIGRPCMDSWLIYRSLCMQLPVIDATSVIDIIHQNHPYPQKGKDSFYIEKERNLKLAGGFMNVMTMREASHLLTPRGLEKPTGARRFFSTFALFYPWRFLFSLRRNIAYMQGKW